MAEGEQKLPHFPRDPEPPRLALTCDARRNQSQRRTRQLGKSLTGLQESPAAPPAPAAALTCSWALYRMPAPASAGPCDMARAAAAPAQAAMARLLLASARLGSARCPAPPLRAPGRCGNPETPRGSPTAPVASCGFAGRLRKTTCPKSRAQKPRAGSASPEETLLPRALL